MKTTTRGHERALLEGLPVAVLETDPAGQAVYVNSRWCEITGLGVEESLGFGYCRAIHPDDFARVRATLEEAAGRDTDTVSCSYRVTTEGKPLWHGLLSARALRDDQGARTGWIGTVTDVTAAHQADERVRALLESSTDTLLVVDPSGTIKFTGPGENTFLGFPLEETLGADAFDLLDPADRTRTQEWLASVIAAPAVPAPPILLRVHHADGHWIPMEVFANNLLDHPLVEGIVISARDITDRERVMELLAEAQARYRQIVELANEGVWTSDADHCATFVNQRMSSMLGYGAGEMIGRPFESFVIKEDREGTDAKLRRRKPELSEQFESRMRHRDGHTVITRVSASPILDSGGVFQGAVALVTDITKERETEAELRYNEARLSALFEASSDIMAIIQPDGYWHASPAGTRILGYPMGYDPSGGILSMIHPDDLEVAATALQDLMDGKIARNDRIRIRLQHLNGDYRWFECLGENRLDDPSVGGVVVIARDITEQKDAEDAQFDAEARFRAAFEHAPVGIASMDLDAHIVDVNPAYCEMMGRTAQELIGAYALELVVPEDRESLIAQSITRMGQPGRTPVDPVRIHRPDGSIRWMMTEAALVTHVDGSEYVLSLALDVTDRKELEEQLEYQAFHDSLTELANRARLRAVLEDVWRRRHEPGHLAVLFVDLDRFKDVNDTLGHDAGDELLLLAARRLEQSVRPGDFIARYGGDEFVVVCERIDEQTEALTIAGRIRENLARDYLLANGPVSIGVCVGVAIDGAEHAEPDDVLRTADQAAYRAKRAGRNRVEMTLPADAPGGR